MGSVAGLLRAIRLIDDARDPVGQGCHRYQACLEVRAAARQVVPLHWVSEGEVGRKGREDLADREVPLQGLGLGGDPGEEARTNDLLHH